MGCLKILLTGGSGKLGQKILESNKFRNILAPKRKDLDLTKPETIKKFFEENEVDVVIHCAALARMGECQNNPTKAIEVNIEGTCNLVKQVMQAEIKKKKKIRFIFISTDGVYPGDRGNYSEEDAVNPYNLYGWTKLGSECSVNLLSDSCIIRTSFFDPEDIKYESSPTDAYSSKMPINYLVEAIEFLVKDDFKGLLNVGNKRKSDYDRYKEFKKGLKACKFEDVLKEVGFPMAKDASMDCSVWETLRMEKNNGKKED